MGSKEEDTEQFSLQAQDDLSYLFNSVYYKCIIDHVKFSEVVSKMSFMRNIAFQIYSLDVEGKTKEAGTLFMENLRALDEPGKYQSLMHALKELGYSFIVAAIEKGAVNEQHEDHKKILDIFMDPLMEKINPSVMANIFLEKGVISSNDVDKIQKTDTYRSTYWAAFELLDTIPRKSPNWYPILLDALYNNGHHRLCKEIDPKVYDQKKKEDNQEAESSDSMALYSLDIDLQGNRTVTEHVKEDFDNSHIVFDASSVSPVEKNKCSCSCAQEMDKKLDELKSFFEIKLNNLESKLDQQSKLLEALVNK